MYPRPIDIPVPAVTDAPLYSLDVNETWVSVIIGALKVLLYDGTWASSAENELAEVTRQIDELLSSWYVKEPVVSVPIGSIVYFGSNTPPEKWLICDGSEVSRTTYADLFAVIGTTFGFGDSSTTFNLPNLEERFPYGCDANTAQQPGNHGGASGVVLTVGQLPAHHHRERTIRGSSPFYNDASTSTGGGASAFNTIANTAQSNGTPVDLNTADTGSADHVDILPPFLALVPIIYAGV